MYEILDRIYRYSCKRFDTIKDRNLKNSKDFIGYIQNQIGEVLNKDSLVSDYIYFTLQMWRNILLPLAFTEKLMP